MTIVSVIIPSYNHARYIGQAIQSVLNQTLRDLELIVVDDGSQDDSLKVIQGFNDPRMKTRAQANMGAHAAINAGIDMAQGEYLAVLNSDDRYLPQRLEKLTAALRSAPNAGLASSYLEVIDDDGRVAGVKQGYKNMPPWEINEPSRSFRAGDDLKFALLTENYLATTSNYIFTRTAWEKHGPFRPLRYTHDWDFALRVIRDLDLLLLPEPHVQYRIHGSNTIRENQAAMIFELCWCMAMHVPALAGAEMQRDAGFLSKLLHSIYEHGCSPVLATLMAQFMTTDASERERRALSLLDPQNPHRIAHISYIQSRLSSHASAQDYARIGLRSRLRVFARALKLP